MILGWALFPPLLLFVVSQVRPMLWGRYLAIIVPALALLVAVLVVRMPKARGPDLRSGACVVPADRVADDAHSTKRLPRSRVLDGGKSPTWGADRRLSDRAATRVRVLRPDVAGER